MVNLLIFCTPTCLIKGHMQTLETLIKLLLKEQSDQGLHCLPFHQDICEINAGKTKFRQKNKMTKY